LRRRLFAATPVVDLDLDLDLTYCGVLQRDRGLGAIDGLRPARNENEVEWPHAQEEDPHGI
jgi:hypothetical protein